MSSPLAQVIARIAVATVFLTRLAAVPHHTSIHIPTTGTNNVGTTGGTS